jgi:hypothetical protein
VPLQTNKIIVDIQQQSSQLSGNNPVHDKRWFFYGKIDILSSRGNLATLLLLLFCYLLNVPVIYWTGIDTRMKDVNIVEIASNFLGIHSTYRYSTTHENERLKLVWNCQSGALKVRCARHQFYRQTRQTEKDAVIFLEAKPERWLMMVGGHILHIIVFCMLNTCQNKL